MQARLIELHQQRGRLLERIAHQRSALALQVEPLRAPLALPGRLAGMLANARRFVRDHPYVVGTVIVAVVVFKPRLVLRWARNGLLAWRTWRSMSALVPAFVTDLLRSQLR